jgi:hypothetical protein
MGWDRSTRVASATVEVRGTILIATIAARITTIAALSPNRNDVRTGGSSGGMDRAAGDRIVSVVQRSSSTSALVQRSSSMSAAKTSALAEKSGASSASPERGSA